MKNEVYDVESYQFTVHDKLLLDANIWLFINGMNNPRDKKVKIYSGALRRLFEAKSQIYVDVLITSEFINTYARIKWRQLTKQKITFKTFRARHRYLAVAEEIADSTRIILDKCIRIESGFSTLNARDILYDFAQLGTDFNDQIFIDLCKDHNFTLMTDDGDFAIKGLRVLTANKRLLRES